MKKLKMGMVGGGSGAFIGAVHRRAAIMDGEVEFVAGALSSSREKALASGRAWASPKTATTGPGTRCSRASWHCPKKSTSILSAS
jgi:predicted dehydrogenase